MIKAVEIQKSLNMLYDYGELQFDSKFNYLIDLNFLANKCNNRLIITKKWIRYSGILDRKDFISSLLCYYPPVFDLLLKKVYKEATTIAISGDGKALFNFVDSIPKFSQAIIRLKGETVNETEEIKTFYQVIFGGYPHYQAALSRLKAMQKAEEQSDSDCAEMGGNPSDIWVSGRKIASQVDLEKLNAKNTYTHTPYKYNDFPVSNEVSDVLSNPWKTFITVLCMVMSEYEAEGFEGICLRPTDKNNAYSLQPLDIYIYNVKGREIRLGRLKDFTYEFCSDSGFSLFPDMAPDVDKIVFDMLENEKITYKDSGYVLNTAFKDRIYSKDIIIKNRSRRFKNVLKDYIEKLRNAL